MRRSWLGWSVVLWLCGAALSARADEVRVAVAANFANTLEALAQSFQRQSGHTLRISAGSSGALYAQIKHGAPFDVFLSADAARPAQLEREGQGVPGTRIVYAQGKLVLWSARPGVVDAQGNVLRKKGGCAKLAIADPDTAPYGTAAQEVLSRLGLWTELRTAHAIVIGTSVAHAYQFAQSGNATCAFVSWSQVLAGPKRGSSWKVPQELYTPLKQEAILLQPAARSEAARRFLRWLDQDPAVRAVLLDAGYETPKS